MKINELLNKRNAKIAEIKALAEGELNEEARNKIEDIKAEVEAINKDITTARFLAEFEEKEARKVIKEDKEENKINERYDLFKAIREHRSGRLTGVEKEMHEEGIEEIKRAGGVYDGEGLIVPHLILAKRADVLASNTSNFTHSTLSNDLKVANTKLVLPNLGVSVYEGLNGEFEVPNMAELSASFVAEDAASTVVTVTDGKATLTPRFIAANQVFSKQYLNQTSPQLQAALLNQFIFAIDKGIETEVFNQLSGLTESSASLSAVTWSNLVALQSYIPYANAYVMDRSTFATAKSTDKSTSSGRFVAENGEIDGIAAYGSSLVTTGHIYHGDFSNIGIGYWSSGLSILTDPFTNKSKGKIDIQVSRMADAKVLNSNAFAKMVIG
jgi:HK97 family phage major capsid protein